MVSVVNICSGRRLRYAGFSMLLPVPVIQFMACIALMLAMPQPSFSATLGGVWRHQEDPIWIEVVESEGLATVRRHDIKPETVDSVMLRGVKALPSDRNAWQGEVYAPPLGAFKEATIKLVGDNTMTFTVRVGFFSRTVTWTRVDVIDRDNGDD